MPKMPDAEECLLEVDKEGLTLAWKNIYRMELKGGHFLAGCQEAVFDRGTREMSIAW